MRCSAAERLPSGASIAPIPQRTRHWRGTARLRALARSGYTTIIAVLLAATEGEARQLTREPYGNAPGIAPSRTAVFIRQANPDSPATDSVRPEPNAYPAMPAGQRHPVDVLQTGGVEVLDEYLAARIHQLERRSPQLRAAMALAREGAIPIVIGTPLQVRDRVAQQLFLDTRLGNNQVAQFFLLKSEPGSPRIGLIMIRVHLDRLRAAARWRVLLGPGRARRWLDSTTDAILIHELWGHLVSVLEAGDYTGNCPDPAPGQNELDACVMRRENELRKQLGLKPRTRYALRLLGS